VILLRPWSQSGGRGPRRRHCTFHIAHCGETQSRWGIHLFAFNGEARLGSSGLGGVIELMDERSWRGEGSSTWRLWRCLHRKQKRALPSGIDWHYMVILYTLPLKSGRRTNNFARGSSKSSRFTRDYGGLKEEQQFSHDSAHINHDLSLREFPPFLSSCIANRDT